MQDEKLDMNGDCQETNMQSGFKAWWARKKLPFFWWALSFSIVLLLLWSHVIIPILPGHAGVLYRRFLGGTEMDRVYKEGTHVVFPWNTMYIFDTRLHRETHKLLVLDSRGLELELEVVIIYMPEFSRIPQLLTTVGLDYRDKLVLPVLAASVRGVAAKYDSHAFYTAELIQRMGDEILITMIGSIGRNPVIMDKVLISQVKLPKVVEDAISNKLVAEQKIYELQYTVKQAQEIFKRKYVEANAVRMTQEIVNEHMSKDFLRWQGIEATKALAESQNSKIVLFGGQDGLPIILNMDSNGSTEGLDKPSSGVLPVADSAENQNDTKGSQIPALPNPDLPVEVTGSEGLDRKWIDLLNMETLEQLSIEMEKAIGIPLYNNRQSSQADSEKGERP